MKKKIPIMLRQVKFPLNEHLKTILLGFVDAHAEGNITSARKHLDDGPKFPGIRIHKEKVKIFALISQNKIVGITGFSIRGKFATNSWTVVAKSHRQKGMGSYLLKLKLAVAKAEGITAFNTSTAVENVPTVKLLEKIGFRPIEFFEGSKREMVRHIHFLEDIKERKEEIKGLRCHLE